jgi:hypothetical protein
MYGALLHKASKLPGRAQEILNALREDILEELQTAADPMYQQYQSTGTWTRACIDDLIWLGAEQWARKTTNWSYAGYKRVVNQCLNTLRRAWDDEQLRQHPELGEWNAMFGTDRREWIHDVYNKRKTGDAGRQWLTKLRIGDGYPYCLGRSGCCGRCLKLAQLDEYHIIWECNPNDARGLQAHRRQLADYVMSQTPEGTTLLAKLETHENDLVAWCLGSEVVWNRTPATGDKRKDKRLYYNVLNTVMEILAAVCNPTRSTGP